MAKVLPRKDLERETLELAKEICGNSPVGMMVAKKGLNYCKKELISRGLNYM